MKGRRGISFPLPLSLASLNTQQNKIHLDIYKIIYRGNVITEVQKKLTCLTAIIECCTIGTGCSMMTNAHVTMPKMKRYTLKKTCKWAVTFFSITIQSIQINTIKYN